jgi:signal recognition particle GTPase
MPEGTKAKVGKRIGSKVRDARKAWDAMTPAERRRTKAGEWVKNREDRYLKNPGVRVRKKPRDMKTTAKMKNMAKGVRSLEKRKGLVSSPARMK